MRDTLQTEAVSTERAWTEDGIPILTASLSLPKPVPCTDRTERRIQRYYQSQGRAFLRACELNLLPQAKAAYRAALADSRPLPCLSAALTYTVTYNADGLWSLYTQSRETGLPGHPTLLRRWGDTWNLHTGYPIPLQAAFPKQRGWKRALLAQIAQQIRQQETCGLAQYHPNWPSALRRCFNPRNFFLTETGISVFFPMFALAPAAEGIPTFSIPQCDAALHTTA